MKKARFIWRSTCTTCRNARAFLRDQLGVELDERDYARNPLSEAELREIFRGHDPRDFINPKSPQFKAMGLSGKVPSKDLSAQEAIAFMAKETRLIKRPLTLARGKIVAGFDKDNLSKLLG